MSDTSNEEASWWDETVQAVESTYDAAVQTVEQTYDSAAQTVEQTYDYAADTAQQTYDYAADTAQQTYDYAADTAQQTYDYAADTAQQAYDYAVDAADQAYEWGTADFGGAGGAPADGDGTEGGGAESHTFDEIVKFAVVHGLVHVVDSKVHKSFNKVPHGTVTLAELVYEIATGPGDTSLHNLQIPSYMATCDGDHNGSTWAGPHRRTSDEARADLEAHIAECADHVVKAGLVETPGGGFAAGCEGDHGGTSWSGPERDSEDYALEDLADHLADWPDHNQHLFVWAHGEVRPTD